MSDIIITPASGKIDFYQDLGAASLAKIELTSANDLSLSTTSGNLIIGDASRDIYIGNGINDVDIIFEQNGEIRPLPAKTLNIGTSGSFTQILASKVNINQNSFTSIPLDVYSPTSGATILNVAGTKGTLFSVTDNLSGSLMSVNNDAGLPVFEVFSDDRVVAGRFGQNDFVMTSGGNVGIGTGVPSSKFHVLGTSTFNGDVSSTGSFIAGSGSAGNPSFEFSGDTDTGMFTPSGNVISFATSGVERLRIDNIGRIGIGTTAPTSTLQVSGLVTANSGTFGNVMISGNMVSATNSNGNLIIKPNASGSLQADDTGNSRGIFSVDLQRSRVSVSGVAHGNYSVIGGGSNNSSIGPHCTIGGGISNTAGGDYYPGDSSTVGGGQSNIATGEKSTVGGGASNNAAGNYSIVGGGSSNSAGGIHSTVGGGYNNSSGSNKATVGGGFSNSAGGEYSTVGGGSSNSAGGYKSTVGGGGGNSATGENSTISGGTNNTASGYQSTIGGGNGHTSSSYASTIGGGKSNSASNYDATVGGGRYNTATGNKSTIGGGYSNEASEIASTIGGGYNNSASGYYSTVGGGKDNSTGGPHCTVGGGLSNSASNYRSTVGGGQSNSASGYKSTVGGGYNNSAGGGYSTVPGGIEAKTTRHGETSHSAGKFSNDGDAQHTILIARNVTTNATPAVLFLDGSSGRLTIPAKTTWTFDIKLSAYNDTNNLGAGWNIRGAIRRNAANGTSILGTNSTTSWIDGGVMNGLVVSVTADDTNEALQINVTGLASTNIRWVAVVDISQVSYSAP